MPKWLYLHFAAFLKLWPVPSTVTILNRRTQIVVECGWDYCLSFSLIIFFLTPHSHTSSAPITPRTWSMKWACQHVDVRFLDVEAETTWSTLLEWKAGSHAVNDIVIYMHLSWINNDNLEFLEFERVVFCLVKAIDCAQWTLIGGETFSFNTHSLKNQIFSYFARLKIAGSGGLSFHAGVVVNK